MRLDSLIGIFCGPLRYTRIYTRGPKPRYEHPKQAVHQGRWIASSVCAVHVVPALITLVLVCLNASNVYVGPSSGFGGRINIMLDALQFAAKLHEVLIGASISTMALFFIQYAITGEGISLGSLHVASRITELRTLFGPELWAAGFRGGLNTKLLTTTSIAVFLIILAASSGPASAILMLPSLDWWSFDARILYNGTDPVVCIWGSQSSLWPQHINALSVSTFYSLGVMSSVSTPDVAAGWSTILQGLNYTSYEFESQTSWNITMPEEGLYTRFVGIAANWTAIDSNAYNESDDFVANRIIGRSTSYLLGSILTTMAGDVISKKEETKFKLSLADSKDVPAPLTATECISTSITVIDGIPHGYESLDDFQFRFLYTDGQYWYVDARQYFEELWNATDSNGGRLVQWVESPNDGIGSPSIGAVALEIFGGEHNTTLESIQIATCSFFGSWKASGLSFDPSTSQSVDFPSMEYSASDFWQSPTAVDAFERSDTVHIDADWAIHALPINNTFSLIEATYAGRPSYLAVLTGVILTALITDSMSRVLAGAWWQTPEKPTTAAPDMTCKSLYGQEIKVGSNPDEFTYLYLSAVRYGYSYSARGSLRCLALSILLLHLLLALLHTAFVIWTGWSSNILNSFCEILALAINSPPSLTLENTCAGIERWSTYKHVVKVREVSNAHLGFVVGDEYITSKTIMEGKLYGSIKNGKEE